MADSLASTSSASRPRRGLRYSLRALLILVTLASVGVWYWYRVPFRKEALVEVMVVHDAPGDPVDPRFRFFNSKQTQRYRRALRGDPIREGLTELCYPTGERLGEEHWRDGVLHGPWVRTFRRGNPMERGEYLAGKKHGLWELFNRDGGLSVQLPYYQGAPHGEAKWFDHGTLIRTVTYDHGEITHLDGQVVLDALGRSYRTGLIDMPVVRERIVDLFFAWYPSGGGLAKQPRHPSRLQDYPLKGFAPYVFGIRDYDVNVIIDSKCNRLAEAPSSVGDDYMPAGTMLFLILYPHGLVSTYRHGCVWITTKEDAQSWVDRTGVSDLSKSPPEGVSKHELDELKRNLGRPLTISFVGMSAADVANHLRTAEKLPITWAGAIDGPKVSTGFRELPLRHILGAICEQHDLRVRWGQGASLVLEPQDQVKP